MRVFYSNNFRGHYPVGTSAVIVARDKDEAHVLLTSKLIGMGLPPRPDDNITIHEVPTDCTSVTVLQDGDY